MNTAFEEMRILLKQSVDERARLNEEMLSLERQLARARKETAATQVPAKKPCFLFCVVFWIFADHPATPFLQLLIHPSRHPHCTCALLVLHRLAADFTCPSSCFPSK